MAQKVSSLAIDINVTGAPEASAALANVEKQGKQASESMQSALTLLKGYFSAQTLKSMANMAEQWQLIGARVSLYAKDASDAQRIQSQLLTTANATRSSLDDQARIYTRIAAQAESLGASSQQILAVTKLVGQANAVSGATTAEAAASAQQLAQALGSGKLAGDELKSILENSPRLAQAIADGLGVSVGALKEMGKEGELLSSTVFAALLTQSEKVSAEFSKIPPTIGGAMTVALNSITESLGSLNNQLGITQSLARAIMALFGDDRSQIFFGENPLESRTGGRGKSRIFVGNRGKVREAFEENAAFSSQSQQNPLFGAGGGFGGPGFGVTSQFRPTFAGALAGGSSTNGSGVAIPTAPTPTGGTGNGNRASRVGGFANVASVGRARGGIMRLQLASQLGRQRGALSGVDSGISDSVALIGANLEQSVGPLYDRVRVLGDQVGTVLGDSISNGITAAVQSGSIGEGLKELGRTLIGGLGAMVRDFGIQALKVALLTDGLLNSLARFIPGGAIASSVAMIALGSAMVGLAGRGARASFGTTNTGINRGAATSSTIIERGSISGSIFGGGLGSPLVSGQMASGSPVTVNATIIGPNDPNAQRQMQELMKRASARGAV